jgi:hypothetical protein
VPCGSRYVAGGRWRAVSDSDENHRFLVQFRGAVSQSLWDSCGLVETVRAAPSGSPPRSIDGISPRSLRRYAARPPMAPTSLADRSYSPLDLGRDSYLRTWVETSYLP